MLINMQLLHYFLFSQGDINSSVVIFLLILILFFAGNFDKRLKNAKSRFELQKYLNITAKLRSIEYAPIAIISVDVDGIIVAWNGGAYGIFGYTEKEILGQNLSIIIPDRYKARHELGLQKLKYTGQSNLLGTTFKTEGINNNKKQFPIELTLWRWYDNITPYYTGIIRDITLEKKLKSKNDAAFDIYMKGEDIEEMGIWSWDVLNDKVSITEGFKKIFDIEVDEDIDSNYLLRRVFHEDLPNVEATIKDAFETKRDYTISYRIVTRNGSILPVTINAKTYLNASGELINITGTIHKN